MNEIRKAINERKQLKSKFNVFHKDRHFSDIQKMDVPKGLYEQCPNCGKTINKKINIQNDYVCSDCSYHFRMRSIDRIQHIVDRNSFIEKGIGYITLNPLFLHGYEEKIQEYKSSTHLDEAYIYGYGEIHGQPAVIGVMDSYFLMGSMGSVVGEKVTKTFEYAIYKKLPVIIFTASGGARMQEGIFSLMQMAKTSAAVAKHANMGLLYISVLTHPTTGGVTASFASLGDIILAEPDALIGFAGPRVIEQTIKQTLPEGFQKSEFLLEKGFIDKVVHRKDMKNTLSRLLSFHQRNQS
ncbi:MAG: acetyl-CoA carboxylase, carboxyltransferase subunit beta [Acholeplasma sp.]|uniref:Acetyl-coenzyme A carboxylase carboxyl transferase subunit beta n=1 Tax=Hujiaoplasma nucleasis TaxID=2725268 RepID=A0A7L6N747_9MOLU|nr:acetyl-CoA carboxylase, carboxyltransferase subunit beta [Hujiaoplasma nucleasis]MDY0278317.1 acetyl-CoA carboxylase, carboxyltransferase subunit beta [Acholeplasma sp.]QLY40795.1 acetyl-CoA carboxylase carboxyltransferase subunit beta [Hujiaoplasma nucleasis]